VTELHLDDRVALVGSGALGFGLTDPYDCHVYLVDGVGELALADVGAGRGASAILDNVRRCGFDPLDIRHIVLTHAHGDHGGGAARMRRLLPHARLYASSHTAEVLEAGDEAGASLDVAKAPGFYPAEYTLERCPVDVRLDEGETIVVGDLHLEALETPGHSDGHLSLLLENQGRRTLLSADAVFFGGKIQLQAIHDCRLDAQISSLRKLRGLGVDVLLPGHGPVALSGGGDHVELANEVLDRLLIPDQLIPA
jgi:glyoxylase-like metal-dependent hydrolase (beta-lactamase superfamily II)